METIGLALAVPPLIQLAFKSFRDIQTLHQQIRVADEALFRVIDRIRTEEEMFRCLIEKLLSMGADLDTQHQLLRPNSDEDPGWTDENLDKNIGVCLGKQYDPASGYIKTIQWQLKSIHRVIHQELRAQQPESSVGGSYTSTMVPLLTSTLSIVGIAPRVHWRRNSKRLSTRRRFSLSTGKIKEIESAYEMIREQNKGLLQCLQVKCLKPDHTNSNKNPVRGPQTELAKSLDTQRSTHRTIKQQTTDLLYQSLSKYHNCPCHSINLSLQTHEEVNEIQLDSPPSASPRTSSVVNYSILVTPGATNKMDTKLLTVVSGCQSDLNLKSKGQQSLCAEVYSASQLPQADEFVMDSFILKTIPCERGRFLTSGIQLKEVCQELNMFDRHYLAALLAQSAQVFHSSPWFASWDTRSIQFFEDTATSKAKTLWRPHLLPKFSQQVHTSNKLRILGLILLELGGIDLDEYAPMEPDSGIKLALKQLTPIAGRPYKLAVQCCFQGCDRLPNNGTRKERDFEEVLEMIKDLERFGRERYRDEET